MSTIYSIKLKDIVSILTNMVMDAVDSLRTTYLYSEERRGTKDDNVEWK
jgi:hypothetical protein